MIDWNVCLTGFALGLFSSSVPCLINYIISAFFRIMQG